jgi:hypothetical protein
MESPLLSGMNALRIATEVEEAHQANAVLSKREAAVPMSEAVRQGTEPIDQRIETNELPRLVMVDTAKTSLIGSVTMRTADRLQSEEVKAMNARSSN